MRGSPLAQGSHTHQVLMGTKMPRAGCLRAQGSLMLGTFLGTGIPLQTEHFMGTELPSTGCLQAQGSPTLGTLWAQGSLVPGALWAQGSPHCGCCKDTGTPPASVLTL